MDDVDPRITGSRHPAPNDFGWNNTYGEEIVNRVQPLTLEQIREGGYLRPGTEPAT